MGLIKKIATYTSENKFQLINGSSYVEWRPFKWITCYTIINLGLIDYVPRIGLVPETIIVDFEK